jgi:phosphoadenosine phosphosulfate reductase
MDAPLVSTTVLTESSVDVPRWLEQATPSDVLRWASDTFGDGLVVTCSFADAVLPHLVSVAAPEAEVVLLDTQYLFAETWWFANKLREDLGLNVTVIKPQESVRPDDLWQTNVEQCCFVRKVEPLQRSLAGRTGWVTGVRRADAPTRTAAPVAAFDPFRGLFKINPLAAMTDDDMSAYIRQHDLLEHPLTAKGFPSIGCWPCTNPVAPGADPRSGRWQGKDKVECGLHK